MKTTITILIVAIVIAFNIWNAINLNSLRKRPHRNDSLNDQKYWELKYKMQYMITVFAIIVFIAGYLGFNSIENVKDSIRKEFQTNVDSLELKVDSLRNKLSSFSNVADFQFERMDSIGKILTLLGIKQNEVRVIYQIHIEPQMNFHKGS